jgi:predicted Zn-dependent protease
VWDYSSFTRIGRGGRTLRFLTLGVLNSIGKESFNYYSAQLLKAQVLLESNRKEEAKKVLESVLKEAKGTYWSNLAQALLMEM